MTRTERVEYRVRARHADYLRRRLELPNDQLSRGDSLRVVLVCLALIAALAGWVL